MKRNKLIIGVSIVLSSVILSSCIGSFTLTHKVLNWNKSLGDKFLNEVVFICLNIVPVYGIAAFADAVVLNTIEFWSGSNPVTAYVKNVKGDKGNYKIERSQKGYKITNEETKDVVVFTFNKSNRTWSVQTNGEELPFMTFVDESHVKMYGSDAVFELSQAGALAYQAVVSGKMAVASR